MFRRRPNYLRAHVRAFGYRFAMTTSARIAEVAGLVGDPARATMLTALMDGRAKTATELAQVAGVTASTTSGHLAKMVDTGLLVMSSQGRHRYFRIASPLVARMLEGIITVAAHPRSSHHRVSQANLLLREARTCYDHLAGRLGVALANAMVKKGVIELDDEAGSVTDSGKNFLRDFGLPEEVRGATRRRYCRPCLDWSERRPHLAGALGSALLARTVDLGWIVRAREGRAVSVTPKGRRGLAQHFGVDW
jgi:DNA-binding transcriptional ArsR family regulator